MVELAFDRVDIVLDRGLVDSIFETLLCGIYKADPALFEVFSCNWTRLESDLNRADGALSTP